ncbi:hypothetical protein O0L34_g13971 [Tuta absoluta]|nr:hypothetical protein O0L34_g13971 [Tuta absoluta]
MVLLIVVVKFLVFMTYCDAMTMKQIRNTGKMIRKTCLPKTNVEEEKIDKITEGVFIEEKEVMCYMACVMKMANTFKNGKFNYESAMKQADMLLPDEIKEPAKVVLTTCKKVPDAYKDPCEGSFHLAKCLQKENPAIFFFP